MAAAIVSALVLILAGQKALGKGLVLGTLFSVLNFILIGEIIPLQIGQSRGSTFFFSFFSVGLRYVLLAVPLILAIKLDGINMFTAIFGIFMVQLMILADHFYRFIKP
jgi:hypothetical protein